MTSIVGGSRGPSGRPPLRIVLAALVTVVLVAVWAAGALLGDGGDDPSSADAPGPTTTAAPATTTTTEAPLVDVEPGWPRKGMSRFGESEESKQLRESLPPTSTTSSTTSSLPDGSTSLPRRGG